MSGHLLFSVSLSPNLLDFRLETLDFGLTIAFYSLETNEIVIEIHEGLSNLN